MVRRRQVANLLAGLALAGVLWLVAYGLPAIDRSLPASEPVPPGRPYDVGAGVTVLPPPGAHVDLTRTRPAQDRGTAVFLLGAVRYAITVAPFDGGLSAAAERLRTRITGTAGYQVTGAQSTVATAGGVPGLQGGYTAPGRAGRYAVFLSDGYAVEVTVSGTDMELARALPGIEVATGSIRREADS
jgi:hypothetical protein